MDIIKGGVTAAKGFLAGGVHCGAKRKNKDLAIVHTKTPANMAATFTTNIVKAAPVLWNKKIFDDGSTVKAIVVNSGNANACTGKIGMTHANEMAAKTGEVLGIDEEEVLVASTGVIGVKLPIDIICNGIVDLSDKLGDTEQSADDAANAIRTTDTYSKQIAVTVMIDGKKVTIGGMAKGSGMIHPNMATMLSFITTDINISKTLLRKALSDSIKDSYNMISVDGDTSTNDMVILLANGEAGNEEIIEVDQDYKIFKEALDYINIYLAKLIVADGEGVTKFIEVSVKGAKNKEDARLLSKSVITSNLVKTAFFGEDANWGRILCAMGYSSAEFDPNKVSLHYVSDKGKITLVENGLPIDFDEDYASSIISERDIIVEIELDEGNGEAKAWGCDLSYEYVKINGEYRT
ncbi:bifunctional ornithine acetyltransferase/N-acetylglutamate synthase [Vallitalea guaymasensis]|uniref:Arginine biosynthesis bifunctional protein ArgJ n=1 Tax=Vallitalea guaymasensis TaxID=1185412 RepID=A0A8J8MDJ3_9FIRM|nr:bifunctional ornithine acetyltransferase/N-acetylglutamate synthase [Vallitalea guaymasensis]QUH30977.1 bifunctional ornithine acetyltransferase/N-acetylglutamate synthase [Vallitalea guaymasensis]